MTFSNNIIIFSLEIIPKNKNKYDNEKNKFKTRRCSYYYESPVNRSSLFWVRCNGGADNRCYLCCFHRFRGYDGYLSLLWLRLQFWFVLVRLLGSGRGNNYRLHLCSRYADCQWSPGLLSRYGTIPCHYSSHRRISRRLWESHLQGWAISCVKNQSSLMPAIGVPLLVFL